MLPNRSSLFGITRGWQFVVLCLLLLTMIIGMAHGTVLAAGKTPASPTNLVAKATSPTQIVLSWKDNSNNEDGWIIEWKEEKAAQWQSTKSVNPNTPNWGTSAGYFKQGTKYLFRVYAYNKSGNSDFYAGAQVTTPPVPQTQATSQTQLGTGSTDDSWLYESMDRLRDIYRNMGAPGLSGTSSNQLGQLREQYRQAVEQARTRGPLLFTIVPALLTPSPYEGISNLTPRLSWWGVATAKSYELQVAADSTFAKLVVSRTGILNSYFDVPSGLQFNTTYYWRVRAITTQGTSSWTKPGIFKTN